MSSSLVRMRTSLVRMRSSLARMRSSLVVRASDCQCTSCNGPGFDPSIHRHSGTVEQEHLYFPDGLQEAERGQLSDQEVINGWHAEQLSRHSNFERTPAHVEVTRQQNAGHDNLM